MQRPPSGVRTSRGGANSPATPGMSPKQLPSSSSRPAARLDRPRGAIAVQDPCHLRHAQRIMAAPRSILTGAGYTTVEIDPDGICCGAAGIYSLLRPRRRQSWGAEKPIRCAPAGPGWWHPPTPVVSCNSARISGTPTGSPTRSNCIWKRSPIQGREGDRLSSAACEIWIDRGDREHPDRPSQYRMAVLHPTCRQFIRHDARSRPVHPGGGIGRTGACDVAGGVRRGRRRSGSVDRRSSKACSPTSWGT